ncbi:PREDICTED: uncharacterized protein LOC104756559 [Camelina sativa]|uniref:Uncharacterized protein LOC104756559 n=1 Tax=Camelina sativa TaxID=90675 RepID=A0ABM1R7C8_CAMSA|nr:PREDICTED: uncharacterized protein LOC104756559 [Camelina sativa]
MAPNEDLEFSFLNLPENFGALTDCVGNSSLLVSENQHNNLVGLVPFSAATNNVFSSPLVENSNNDQGTFTRTPSIEQETAIVPQNQSFHQEEDYSKYLTTTVENFHDMSSCVLSSGQRESVYNGLQSINLQGPLEQSYQQPLLSQTIPCFSNVPYASTMVRSNMQEVEKANEPTNFNLIQHGLQDHHFQPSLYHQEEQFDHNESLLEQIIHIHETDYKMQLPKFSNMSSTPTSVGTLLNNNQCLIPDASTSNTIMNPGSGNYSPFTQTSYQPDSVAYAFQKPSPVNPPRRPRGRPRRYPSVTSSSLTNTAPKNMALVPTTQTLLAPPRPYCPQDKGKQHVTGTSMPALNPTLYNQYQNSHTNSLIQQSGGFRQRSCYDQFENEGSSSKRRRITFPFQETSVAASSVISSWQNGNMSTNGANLHEERLTNTVYDPRYAGAGLAIDPHLRFF